MRQDFCNAWTLFARSKTLCFSFRFAARNTKTMTKKNHLNCWRMSARWMLCTNDFVIFSFYRAMQSSFFFVLYLHLTSNSFARCFRNFLRWLFRTLFVILIWSVAHKHLFILIFLHLMQHNGPKQYQYCKCSLAWLN